jgi:DNA-directed RNA polymerase II subunit RPB2
VDKSGKLVPPRKLNNTSWGFICPAETPEGGSVGIVKNLSYMTHVTLHSSSEPLHDVVSSEIQSIDRVELREAAGCAKVFINGAWTGITRDPMALYTRLKRLKTSGRINVYTSIIFDCAMGEIRVCNDCGRLTRPVLRVVDGKLLLTDEMLSRLRSKSLTWDELMTTMVYDNAVIEYIDPDEQNHSMIAMSPKHLTQTGPRRVKYTHCEIHPSTIFGIVASCNPFPEHNQSPRNTYQCAQAKQAMGIYATNFDLRMDKTSYVLTTPGRPLIDTRVMNIIKLNEFPSGYTAMVAIMAYTGYNQEDSIIVNQGAIDRGLLQVTLTHTEKDDDKHRVNGDEEVRCRPDRTKTRGMKFGNYDKVNTKGVVPQNTFLENGDVIIAKKTPIKENRNNPAQVMKFDDQSRTVRLTEEAYVDKTCLDKNGDGYNFAKVRVRIHRAPVIGDKFSSRHGQKGTVSNILPESDMPFTRDGVRPDIIINPHAIPSRMTIGQLKESLLGCVLLQLGLFGDGTSFGELSRESICKKLLELGHEAHGNELMYDGLTGRQLECSIFFGPVFYQRLKHMVNDKQHSRSSGPMIGPARQPAEGRARNGGLRFGEMERDCMISHGASRFTRERLYDASDKFAVHVCKNCGLIATFNDRKSIHHCHACSNRTAFAYVEIPYACKLLFQELTTMSVVPRLLTNH